MLTMKFAQFNVIRVKIEILIDMLMSNQSEIGQAEERRRADLLGFARQRHEYFQSFLVSALPFTPSRFTVTSGYC